MNIHNEELARLVREYFGADKIDEAVMNRVSNAIYFVHDLLHAEAKATKEKEPYATRFIDRAEDAARELVTFDCDVFDMLDDMRLEQMKEV